MNAIIEYTNGKNRKVSGSAADIMFASISGPYQASRVFFECPTCMQIGHHADGCDEYDKERAKDNKRVV